MVQDEKPKPGETRPPEKIKKTTNDGSLSEEELDKVPGGVHGGSTVSKF